jgi:hypothetical protein
MNLSKISSRFQLSAKEDIKHPFLPKKNPFWNISAADDNHPRKMI